jgi:tripartite-type tricarboxylate transporter receptor subunit TctC
MLKRKRCYLGVILSVLFVLMLAGWTERVHAQDKYPTRAIDIIVPYAPGGATDVAARQVANYLKSKWGVPVNIVSKPGGRGIPALLDLYQSAPDGYTMLSEDSASASMLAAATATTKDLPFDTMNRTFVLMFKAHPFVIFVPSTSPFKTLKDFIAEAKKNTKDISYTAGPSALEYAIRQVFSEASVNISMAKAVMCKGAAEAVILAAGGNVTIGAAAVSTTLPALKAGTIKPLLITSKSRWPDLPDLPSSAELGYPGVNTVHWVGISGPPKLPSNISNMWDKAIQEMLRDPGFITQMKNTGGIAFYHTGQATAEFVRKETEEAIRLFK